MTLPSSFPLSMSQVASELNLSASGLSLEHPWVLALGGKSAAPISMSDLLGQTGSLYGAYTGQAGGGNPLIEFNGAEFFGGSLNFAQVTPQGGGSTMVVDLAFNNSGNTGLPTTYRGQITLTNNTTGASVLLTYQPYVWIYSGALNSNLIRSGYTDEFSVDPYGYV